MTFLSARTDIYSGFYDLCSLLYNADAADMPAHGFMLCAAVRYGPAGGFGYDYPHSLNQMCN